MSSVFTNQNHKGRINLRYRRGVWGSFFPSKQACVRTQALLAKDPEDSRKAPVTGQQNNH